MARSEKFVTRRGSPPANVHFQMFIRSTLVKNREASSGAHAKPPTGRRRDPAIGGRRGRWRATGWQGTGLPGGSVDAGDEPAVERHHARWRSRATSAGSPPSTGTLSVAGWPSFDDVNNTQRPSGENVSHVASGPVPAAARPLASARAQLAPPVALRRVDQRAAVGGHGQRRPDVADQLAWVAAIRLHGPDLQLSWERLDVEICRPSQATLGRSAEGRRHCLLEFHQSLCATPD